MALDLLYATVATVPTSPSLSLPVALILVAMHHGTQALWGGTIPPLQTSYNLALPALRSRPVGAEAS